MPCQTRHLGQVAHRGLARVRLPVGIGVEADRRIEGKMLRRSGKLFGIERQDVLKALDEIGHHDADHAEHQQRCRVFLPVLRRGLLDSGQAQKKALDRAQGTLEGPPFAFKYAVKIDSQRLGKRENHQ